MIVNEKLVTHMSKKDIILGDNWKKQFLMDGVIGNDLISIGSTKEEALSNLLRSAPLEYKKIVFSYFEQNKSLRYIRSNEYSVSEVKGLIGVYHKLEDKQCIQIAKPNTNLNYDVVTECRFIVRIKVSQLLKSYKVYINSKYKKNRANSSIKDLYIEYIQ